LLTAAPGASSVSLSTGSIIPAAGSCTITVSVRVTGEDACGSFTNTLPLGSLQTTNGGSVAPAVATLVATCGVVIADARQVPTMSEWAMILLAMLMASFALFAMRRRKF
jgi:hypothetical protein